MLVLGLTLRSSGAPPSKVREVYKHFAPSEQELEAVKLKRSLERHEPNGRNDLFVLTCYRQIIISRSGTRRSSIARVYERNSCTSIECVAVALRMSRRVIPSD